ncbi:MAG: hypothetical protein IPK72_03935 [Candidatus Eisenbacteria bacterium]|nr:hypothetical protein [Candidatus Eisenbacteria bacterium]
MTQLRSSSQIGPRLSSWHRRAVSGLAMMTISAFLTPGLALACKEDAAAGDLASLPNAVDNCPPIGVNNPAPFLPVAGLTSPLNHGDGCYSIAKLPPRAGTTSPVYVVFMREDRGPGANGIYRWESTNQGASWSNIPTTRVIPAGAAGIQLAKCTDLVWSNLEGRLHVYFSADNGNLMAYASSNDYGVTLTPAKVVLTPGNTNAWDQSSVQNPSIIDIKEYDPSWVAQNPRRRIMLAYAGMNASLPISSPKWSGIGVAYADRWNAGGVGGRFVRRDYGATPSNPARTGACITEDPTVFWKEEKAYRPRLIVDSSTNTVYLFYVGVEASRCQRIAYMTSTNWGDTWECGTQCGSSGGVTTPPAFDGFDSPYDNKGTYCPDLIDESTSSGVDLRLYYLGQSDPDMGVTLLSASTAAWPGSPPPRPVRGARDSILLNDRSESVTTFPEFFTVSPNPSRGAFQITLHRVSGFPDGAGELAVFDVQGRGIRSIWSGELSALPATIEWDGKTEGNQPAPSGRYAIVLKSPGLAPVTAWVSLSR